MRTDGRTDRRTGVTKLLVAFRNFANAPKTGCTFIFHGKGIKSYKVIDDCPKETVDMRPLVLDGRTTMKYRGAEKSLVRPGRK